MYMEDDNSQATFQRFRVQSATKKKKKPSDTANNAGILAYDRRVFREKRKL